MNRLILLSLALPFVAGLISFITPRSIKKFPSVLALISSFITLVLCLGIFLNKPISFVYSGRGFHVKVHDQESEKLSFKERTAINDSMKGLPIDRWVSGGHSKLMRLPFSLHGLVSRIVTPLPEKDLPNFDASTDERVIPHFLQE